MEQIKARESERSGRIDVLDGYRALAILAVMGFHYGVQWTPPASPINYYPYGSLFSSIPGLAFGGAGLELFFVISGFVIVMTLQRCVSFGDFVRRRVARLCPSMFFCVTLTAIILNTLGPSEWHVQPIDWILSVLFIDPAAVGRLIDGPRAWVDGAYWSLSVEVRFYALAAIMFLLFRYRFLQAWLALQILSFLLNWGEIRNVGWHFAIAHALLLPKFLPYFTLGISLFYVHQDRKWNNWPIAGVALATTLIFVQGEQPLIAHIAIVLLFFLFITDNPIVRVFGRGLWVKLGRASFSLYLLHQLAGVVLIEKLSSIMPPVGALVVVFIGMIGVSMLVFRYVEVPGKRYILDRTNDLVLAIQHRAPWLSYQRISSNR